MWNTDYFCSMKFTYSFIAKISNLLICFHSLNLELFQYMYAMYIPSNEPIAIEKRRNFRWIRVWLFTATANTHIVGLSSHFGFDLKKKSNEFSLTALVRIQWFTETFRLVFLIQSIRLGAVHGYDLVFFFISCFLCETKLLKKAVSVCHNSGVNVTSFS